MKPITIHLPDPLHTALEQHANANEEPPETLAANLLQEAFEEPPPTTEPPPTHPQLPHDPTPPEPPPWLPTTDPAWHHHLWNAIVTLHERYPRALARLENDWWTHPDRTEPLAALATWRAQIDTQAQDPREELAFHTALTTLTTILDQTPGGKPRFQPDTPPPPADRVVGRG